PTASRTSTSVQPVESPSSKSSDWAKVNGDWATRMIETYTAFIVGREANARRFVNVHLPPRPLKMKSANPWDG
ncbi:hypothetical protein N9132_01335, partial [bacterium]|nr:hypothetical protein [bacterium]